MNSLVRSFRFTCPWCWEQNECLADLSAEDQHYIEDCRVCCHPIQIAFSVIDNEITNLTIERSE